MTDGRHARRSLLDETAADASLFVSVFKKPFPVLVAVPIAILIGLAVLVVSPDSYTATAEILVQDVRSSDLFQVTDVARPSTQQSDRYLADQVALLRSSVAAARTSQSLDGQFSERYILEKVSVDGDASSNLIRIIAPAPTPEQAKGLADALAATYFDLRTEDLRASAEAAVNEIDALLTVIDGQLANVQDQLEALRQSDTQQAALDQQFDDALAQLTDLRQQRDAAPVGSEERNTINTEIQELTRDFQSFNLIYGTNRPNPDLTRLQDKEAALTNQRLDLESRRNAISVTAQLSENAGATDLQSVIPENPDGPGGATVIGLFVLLGMAVGASVSYVQVHRRTHVESRYEPAEILGVPLLGTVPTPRRSDTTVDVVSDPDSDASYAYRFSASALDLRSAGAAKMIMTVSAHGGRDRSVIVANLTAAAALSGLRVLAVDADFQLQGLTRFILGELGNRGLIDFIAGGADVEDVLVRRPIPGVDGLDLVPQSRPDMTAAGALQSSRASALFSTMTDDHDLVVLDAPSVLEAAYTALLARFVDGLVVVVEQHMRTEDLEELAARLELTGTPVLGYLYSARPRLALTSLITSRFGGSERPPGPDDAAPSDRSSLPVEVR